MFSRFINLEIKQFFRSSYWQKSMALNALMVLLGLYFILIFLGLGIALLPILKSQFPEVNPFVKINDFVFYWLIAELFVRFFMQKLPVMSVKPLLYLPIKKSSIVHYVMGKSVVSYFNVLPLFMFVPFVVMNISNGTSVFNALLWLGIMITLTLIVNFLNFLIENQTADSDWGFALVSGALLGLFAFNYFEIISLGSLMATAINAMVTQPIFALLLGLLLATLYYLNFKFLKNQLNLDASLRVKATQVSTVDMSWTKRFGSVAPFLQLDLKLLWRNKRPRSTVMLLGFLLLYGLFFYPNPTYNEMPTLLVFVGIFITGAFLINFGQFIPAWDSAYYKLLMSQNVTYKDYLRSKYILMVLSVVITFLLSIPYIYFGWKIVLLNFAAALFNAGINTHVLLYAGSYNRKKIDLTKSAAFNYQGTGAVQWLLGFPLLLIPMALFYLFYKLLGFEAGVASLAFAGIFGLIFHQKMLSYIAGRYIFYKYKMIKAFTEE